MPFWPLVARYLDPAHREEHAFLDGGGERERRPSCREGRRAKSSPLRWLGVQLAAAHLGWLAVRLTDGPAARAGFETVKVVIPGLMDMASSREAVDFGLPRFTRPWTLATTAEPHQAPHPLC